MSSLPLHQAAAVVQDYKAKKVMKEMMEVNLEDYKAQKVMKEMMEVKEIKGTEEIKEMMEMMVTVGVVQVIMLQLVL